MADVTLAGGNAAYVSRGRSRSSDESSLDETPLAMWARAAVDVEHESVRSMWDDRSAGRSPRIEVTGISYRIPSLDGCLRCDTVELYVEKREPLE